MIANGSENQVPYTLKESGAKMAPQWNYFGKVEPFCPHIDNHVWNGTALQSDAKMVSKWGPLCGYENGSTMEQFQLHLFLSVYPPITNPVIRLTAYPTCQKSCWYTYPFTGTSLFPASDLVLRLLIHAHARLWRINKVVLYSWQKGEKAQKSGWKPERGKKIYENGNYWG